MSPGMSYSLRIKSSAVKELSRIDKPERIRLIEAIDRLPENPFQGRKLKGDRESLRRIRVGSYRIIYEVRKRELLILVIKVSHRQHAYQ